MYWPAGTQNLHLIEQRTGNGQVEPAEVAFRIDPHEISGESLRNVLTFGPVADAM